MANELNKNLSLSGLTMIAIGSCIGSGIFLTPSEIATHLPSSGPILLVWILGGVIALTGALTFAELGGIFTGTGGVYVYLKEAYGPLVAFLYGWISFTVISTGAIAALMLAFARYVDYLLHVGTGGVRIIGLAGIVVVTVINIFGVKLGEYFAKIFTGLKLAGIFFIVAAGVWFFFSSDGISPSFSVRGFQSSSFALALVGVLWSYGGWHHASYLAGEAVNPERTVPRAMLLGTIVVVITYLLTNLSYLFLLPVEDIAGSSAVAADAVGVIFQKGGVFVALLIAISTFGTAGIYTLSAPRIYFAMANDGIFFKQLSKVHPRWKTPVNAIAAQSAWAILLLIFWSTFENLISYVVFMDILFMTLAGASIFIFRKKHPGANRPYRVFAYPLTPLIFITISVWFLAFTLAGKPAQAWAGIAMAAAGVLIYYFFKKKN